MIALIGTMMTACAGTPSKATEVVNTQAVTTGQETTVGVSPTTGAVDLNKPAFDSFPRPRIVVDRPLKLAAVIRNPEVESVERTQKELKIEAAHYGWDLTILYVKDESEYKDAFLNAISLNVDAILIGNLNSMASLADVIAQARNAGIGVYNDDTDLVTGVVGNSTMPNGVASMQLMYRIGEDHAWTGNVAYVQIPVMQIHQARLLPVLTLAEVFPSWKIAELTDFSTWPGGVAAAMNEIPVSWLDKFGNELTGMYCTGDVLCFGGVEAGKARGRTDKDLWIAGIDGGSDAFAYIRNQTTFMYDYAQAFEAYTHKTLQMIMDVQVKGLNPGDEGCILRRAGETLYSEGAIVTRENVPPIGVSIHTIFSYYDENATDVWYKWMDVGGPYIISAGGVQE